MGNKIVVRRYKYKNIAAAMAIVLLLAVAISTPNKSSKKFKPDSSSSSSAVDDNSSKEDTSSAPFVADKIINENYKYVNVINKTELSKGKLTLVNSANKFKGKAPSDLDGVYSYLFNKNGVQIGSTSSTQVQGSKEMLKAFNVMLGAFYDETKLKTIMIRDIYIEKSSDDSKENDTGCIEHETGFSIDLQLYMANEGTYPAFDGTGKYEWFEENCWKYGFILRYPDSKVAITKVEAKPNHFRYVGQPHAEIMKKENLCFEEYIDMLKKYSFQKPYSFESSNGNCYALYYTAMSNENATNCAIPLTESDAPYEYEISGDNNSGYITSVKVINAKDNLKKPNGLSGLNSRNSSDSSEEDDDAKLE